MCRDLPDLIVLIEPIVPLEEQVRQRFQRSPMYGSDTTDPLVKYYDLAFGISGPAEVNWYLRKARTSGGPVLDLGCGTGRLALHLARQGFQVTGIDQSAGMIDLFKAKLRQALPDVRRRVQIERRTMSDFELDGRFGTIICCDAFFHNLTVKEQISCLERVRQHLNPNGRFLFNIPNANCEFIVKCINSAGKGFEERGCYPLEDGSGSVLVEQVQSIDVLDQRIETSLRFTRYDAGGNEMETGESGWTTRYLFRYEAVHLLYRCGFTIENLVGDYRNGPVTEDSQLIFEAVRSSRSEG